ESQGMGAPLEQTKARRSARERLVSGRDNTGNSEAHRQSKKRLQRFRTHDPSTHKRTRPATRVPGAGNRCRSVGACATISLKNGKRRPDATKKLRLSRDLLRVILTTLIRFSNTATGSAMATLARQVQRDIHGRRPLDGLLLLPVAILLAVGFLAL